MLGWDKKALIHIYNDNIFFQSNRRLSYLQSTKTLTGFGPASTNTRFLKGLQLKVKNSI